MGAEDAGDDGQAAIAAAGQAGWARPRGVGRRWKRRCGCGGIAKFSRAATTKLHDAVGVREGDTAGGDSSSRPEWEQDGLPLAPQVCTIRLARAYVAAVGGFGGFQNTESLPREYRRAGASRAAARPAGAGLGVRWYRGQGATESVGVKHMLTKQQGPPGRGLRRAGASRLPLPRRCGFGS